MLSQLPQLLFHHHTLQAHRGRPHTCWVCKDTYTRDAALHDHIASCHQDVVGQTPAAGETAPCRYCSLVCSSQAERVAHTRHNHMVESIDITSTDPVSYTHLTLPTNREV